MENLTLQHRLTAVLLFVFFNITLSVKAQFENIIPNNTATHIAVKSGKWSNASTWGPGQGVPGLASIVVIPEGKTVTYDINSNAHVFAIRFDGVFKITARRNKTAKLIVDSFLGGRNSNLSINVSKEKRGNVEIILKAFDIIGKKSGRIGGSNWSTAAKNHYSDGERVTDHFGRTAARLNDGPGVLGRYKWDPKQATIALMTWGKVRIKGKDKLDFSECAGNIGKGQRSIQMKENPTNWKVGDYIVLAGTEKNFKQNEVLKITNISGKTVTVNANLQFDHKGITLDGKSYYTYVANLSRNIVIRSDHKETQVDVTKRGHVMFMFNGDVQIQNALFKDLGRTDKSNIVDDLKIGVPVVSGVDKDTKVELPNFQNELENNFSKIENQRGRYSLHFHKSLRGKNKEKLILAKGNVVWGSPGWGMVHHDSHADFTDNVVLDAEGCAMAAESGSETGIWRHNFVTGGRRDGTVPFWTTTRIPTSMRRLTRDVLDDDFKLNVGYGLQGRAVRMVDNVAGALDNPYHYQGSGQQVLVADELDTRAFDGITSMVNPFPFDETIARNAVPLFEFKNNVAFNCSAGFKSQGRSKFAFHKVISVIDNMVIWNARGFAVYISSNFGYLIKNAKIHAVNDPPDSSTGLLSHSDTDNVNFNNVTFYNFRKKGVDVNGFVNTKSGNNPKARFIFNKVQWKNSPGGFNPYARNTDNQIQVKNINTNPNATVTFQKASNMDDVVDMKRDFSFAIEGTMRDQAGTSVFANYAPKSDPYTKRIYDFKSKRGLKSFLKGQAIFYEGGDKKKTFIYHKEFMSDRLTGVHREVKIKIYVKNYKVKRRRGSEELTSDEKEDLSTIFPNPASNIVNIHTTEKAEIIVIYSSYGAIVKSIVPEADSDITSIDISGLQPGIYFVEAKLKDSKKTHKLIVK